MSPQGGKCVAVSGEQAELVRHFIYEGMQLGDVRALAKATYGWDDAMVDRADRDYRDFLWVCWNFGRSGTNMTWISIRADQMWHCHLQRPSQYLLAMREIFGRGHVLDHIPVLNGRRVQEADCALVRKHYVDLGMEVPSDLRDVCIWAVVSTS